MKEDYIIWFFIFLLVVAGGFFIAESAVKRFKPVFDNKPNLFFQEAPEIVKAVYFTSTTAGNEKSVDRLIELANKSELNPVRSKTPIGASADMPLASRTSNGINAVVIDIKDFSGYVAYDTELAEVKKYKAERLDIKDIDGLIKKLHDNNIYVIARLTVFQDPVLAKARPDWAVKNKYTGGLWYDRNGLSWINPASSASWDYFAAISQDAAKRGFDELNFDYIRFPSDGDMTALVFPGWNGREPKAEIIGKFYEYLRQKLPGVRLSADMFGFVTTHTDDLGIGQLMEKAFAAFDYISPMVYPSHYPPNYLGFENPAAHPYEVVHTSMKGGIKRLKAYKEKNPGNKTEFRPWLQDFNMGADYTPAMVEAQIKATQDALGENYRGFMLWNARNVYHDSVFK